MFVDSESQLLSLIIMPNIAHECIQKATSTNGYFVFFTATLEVRQTGPPLSCCVICPRKERSVAIGHKWRSGAEEECMVCCGSSLLCSCRACSSHSQWHQDRTCCILKRLPMSFYPPDCVSSCETWLPAEVIQDTIHAKPSSLQDIMQELSLSQW